MMPTLNEVTLGILATGVILGILTATAFFYVSSTKEAATAKKVAEEEAVTAAQLAAPAGEI